MSSGGNCSALTTADAVFEATVESIELKLRPTSSPDLVSPDYKLVTLRDVRAWRGQAASTVVSDSSCGYAFVPGVRYLITADKRPDGSLTVTICGQTRPLAVAGEVIEFLKALTEPLARPRVWGSVLMPVRPGRVDGFGPVANATVAIDGPIRRTLVTDADGKFVAIGLPHGEYTLKASPASGTRFVGASDSASFTLDSKLPRACAALEVLLPVETTVSGVVTDDSGNPRRGVFMTMSGTTVRDGEGGGLGLETDADGAYRFSGLPPGRYRVALDDGGPTPNTPFIPASKTTDPEIDVVLGSRIELPPFRLRRVNEITVRGTALLPNGQPAPDVEFVAALIPERGRPSPCPCTDLSRVTPQADSSFLDGRASDTASPMGRMGLSSTRC